MTFSGLVKEIIQKYIHNRFALIVTGAAVCGVFSFSLVKLKRTWPFLWGLQPDLPMGLPNPRNLCYLNALLQAMAANASLVRFLKRSASKQRKRLLYCLVCLLKGLRCSNRYLVDNDLVYTLQTVHEELLKELADNGLWSSDEQQDAHELFNLFMEIACSRELGHTANDAREGLATVSHFIGTYYRKIVPRCSHRVTSTLANGSINAYTIRSPIRADVFQQHLIATQVSCTKCAYTGSPVLQPEASLTVFLNDSMHEPTSGPFKQKKKSVSLSDCLLHQFGTNEPLPDMACPKCQQRLSLDKQITNNPTSNHTTHRLPLKGRCQQQRFITHLPAHLILHVQRCDWQRQSGVARNPKLLFNMGAKRFEHLRFPHHLDMADYMLSAKMRDRSSSGDSSSHSIRNPQKRMYILRSIVVHQGASLNSGHYVTYRVWCRKNQAPAVNPLKRFLQGSIYRIANFFNGLPTRPGVAASPWVVASDAHVLRVPFEEVNSSLAYLLFYEREPFDARIPTRETSNEMPVAGCPGGTENHTVHSDWSTYQSYNESETDFLLDTDDGYYDEDEYEESEELSDTDDDEPAGRSKAEIIRSFAMLAKRI